MSPPVRIADFITPTPASLAGLAPWQATAQAVALVQAFVAAAGPGFTRTDGNAIHRSAQVEAGAILKPPCFIGPNCLVAAGAYLRGGVWLEGDDIVGPGCELKTTFIFSGSKVAHLSFVGDSVLGHDVNIEAGAMLANYRNERADKAIIIQHRGTALRTGVDKFGTLAGDGVRIGANAVIAPGAILDRGAIIGRLQLVDHSCPA